MQVMIQARAAAQGESAAFKRWSLETWAPRSLEDDAGVAHLIVNLATETSAIQPYGNAESLNGDAFDVVVQIYLQNGSDYERVVKPNLRCFQERSSAYHAYRVTESEVLHKPMFIRGAPTPGIKLMRGLFLFDDLPDPAAQRIWAHHSSLAEKVHVGLARYARHWVDEVLTEGSPNIRGLSDLHFPDEASMRDCYFDSPRGRDEIMHDIGHFIAGGTQRFHAKEYVLK